MFEKIRFLDYYIFANIHHACPSLERLLFSEIPIMDLFVLRFPFGKNAVYVLRFPVGKGFYFWEIPIL